MMDPQQLQAIEGCHALSLAGEIQFPEVVGRLAAAGVERYHADYSRGEVTYYLISGESLVTPAEHGAESIGLAFDARAVAAAVGQSQRAEHTYRDFVQKTMAAGCVGYFVQLTGRRVIYFGRHGDCHVEHFPSADNYLNFAKQLEHHRRIPMTRVQGILETAIYVTDLPRAADFYRRLFECGTLLETERLIALDIAGRSVLLLFMAGETDEPFETPGGVIPPHRGVTGGHFAFGITQQDFEPWANRLTAEQVLIESIVTWPGGARSLYFRDPDGNLAELITTGFWANY